MQLTHRQGRAQGVTVSRVSDINDDYLLLPWKMFH